jgi:hypothetical protein
VLWSFVPSGGPLGGASPCADQWVRLLLSARWPWSEAHSSSHLRSKAGLSEGSAAVFITHGTTDERQWVEPYGYRFRARYRWGRIRLGVF